MILTGPRIAEEVGAGAITIEPFHPAQLNPNSYNYRLGGELKLSEGDGFDARRTPEWTPVEIPREGFLLKPNQLYLAHTSEIIGSSKYVTSLIGRSSMGRLGLFLQVSADLGHQGAIHRWTLELHCVQPLRVYAGMLIGQVSFWRPSGDPIPYEGVYARFSGAQPNVSREDA